MNISQKVFVSFIKIYQKIFSPDHGILKRRYQGCRFYPSCSEYALEAIEKKGVIRGTFLGVKRIIRCNPWNHGGYDPLKD
jgi:putative membrane protein insertion efficiency factor